MYSQLLREAGLKLEEVARKERTEDQHAAVLQARIRGRSARREIDGKAAKLLASAVARGTNESSSRVAERSRKQ